MVVVSGSWVKNVATYPASTSNNDMVIPTNNMSAKAVLICRPNSHPFQERTLCLDQPVKVGRSVARARATSTNAIFDCKVLSRHHALLWYDCGKFYLQDTKSSNGTFVNNNRLSSSETDPHEVSSGDIVQFGVDVVENNRKVTHGCIIATLKLYLPDGKEAKASPSITEGNRHGFVRLDELYELNQIIQEASQREQCLETKLSALQHVVDEARRSADESWQAYVGEERLLSRVAALESQLVQAGKNWGEDRLREELDKLNEDRASYQVAAKESLRKLIAERLEAVGAASEHQRARANAEQEAMLAREDLEKSQKEIQQIAQKLSEEQKKSDEEKSHLEQKLRELEDRLETEQQQVVELQNKIEQVKSLAINPIQELLPLEELEEKCNLYIENDFKLKEEMIGENDVEAELNRTNGVDEPQHNHINRTVAPTAEQVEVISVDAESDLSESESQEDLSRISNDSILSQATLLDEDMEDEENAKDFNEYDKTNVNGKDSTDNLEVQENVQERPEEIRKATNNVNSKTLTYQFRTMQNEFNRQMQTLEEIVDANKTTNEQKMEDRGAKLKEKVSKWNAQRKCAEESENSKFLKDGSGMVRDNSFKRIADLEDSLKREREVSCEKSVQIEKLRQDLFESEQKRKEFCKEAQRLDLVTRKAEFENKINVIDGQKMLNESLLCEQDKNISTSNFSVEQLVTLEEELVILKERFAQVNDEKLMLNKNLLKVREQYNMLCNRSYNTMFFYIAPLVLMVLYLLVSSMFS